MRHIVIIWIFILLCVSFNKILAQSDFRPGYFVNNDNDTIHGLIDYKGNKANAKKCIYKADSDSKHQEFTPEEIKSFRFIDSKYYVSKTITLENDTMTLFLEYLINGIVDIYYYRDGKGEHYLINNGSINLYELKNDRKEIVKYNNTYIKESKEYIGLLKIAFKESPTIMRKAESISLDHKSLINISQDYHKEICPDKECIIYEKKLPKMEYHFGLFIGLNKNSIYETSDIIGDFDYLSNSQFEGSFSPLIGFYYKKNMPYINERLFFLYECFYSQMNIKITNSFVDPYNNYRYSNNITYSQKIVGNNLLLKYEFNRGTIRPTFHTGAFFSYYFGVNYNRDYEVITSRETIYYSKHYTKNPFRSIDYGLNFGFGLKSMILNKKELFCDFRYQLGLGFFQGLNTSILSILIGYQIGK
ncbi:MAG: hypothetical protein R6W78_16955 [Bacteroidales bacterium]